MIKPILFLHYPPLSQAARNQVTIFSAIVTCRWLDGLILIKLVVLDVLHHSVNFSRFEAIVVLKEVELYQVECDADRVFPQNITVNAPLKFLY